MDTKSVGIRSGLWWFGFCLAVGMIVSSLVIGNSLKAVKIAEQSIRVKGYAEQPISSDMASWRGQITVTSKDLVSGYKRIKADLEKVYFYLQKNGIHKNQVGVSSISTITQYRITDRGISTNEVHAYILQQFVSIQSTNVELIAQIARDSTSLIQEGVELSSFNPEYFYTKTEDLKIQLLGRATKNARERAEQLAENSNSSVANLRSASQGVFQITPLNSTMIADYGSYDTSTIEKSIKAVVTVEYYIEN